MSADFEGHRGTKLFGRMTGIFCIQCLLSRVAETIPIHPQANKYYKCTNPVCRTDKGFYFRLPGGGTDTANLNRESAQKADPGEKRNTPPPPLQPAGIEPATFRIRDD